MFLDLDISLSYSRSHAYRLGGPRASAAASEVLHGNLEHGVNNHEHAPVIPVRCIQPKGFYQRSSIPTKFFVGTQGLSSQAGTKSSGDEDDLEDGFSELESESSDKNNVVKEETAEDLISELELSDDDSEDNLSKPAYDDLELSDDEPSVDSSKKVSQKKTFTSPLFKVIMDSPRQSINSAIDKWVEQGNTLGRTEMAVAMLNLRKRRMFGKALQVLCLESFCI